MHSCCFLKSMFCLHFQCSFPSACFSPKRLLPTFVLNRSLSIFLLLFLKILSIVVFSVKYNVGSTFEIFGCFFCFCFFLRNL